MTLVRALRLSAVVLAAMGLLALMVTGELPLWLGGLGGLAVVASAAAALGDGQSALAKLGRLSPGTWNIFLAAAFFGFVAELTVLAGDILPAAVHFLILLMINKLLNLQQRKDFLQLYALSLMALLASAALTKEIWYGVVFFGYLLAAIWALLLYHLRYDSEPTSSREGEGPGERVRPFTAGFFWSTNGLAIGAFCLTLVIFFVMPRIGAGFFQKNRGDVIRTVGFSDKVDLSGIGAVKLDPTVVMRVEFPEHTGPLGEVLRGYFRGTAYDQYNGHAWANSLARRQALERSAEGRFTPPASGSGATGGIRQDILLEALDTPVLFGAALVQSVKGNFPAVQTDGMGGFYLPYPAATRVQYQAVSAPPRLLEADRTDTAPLYPAHLTDHYLQLPALSPQVEALAKQVTRQAAGTYEAVLAVERYLQHNYQYSLDVGPAVSDRPVEDFLFQRRTGFCEHYATAMVMLLRTLGIPSRLATGFLPGEWNDFGNYYTVRQQDAHAWVEVWFPRSGWVPFDPTPEVGNTLPAPLWPSASKMVDALRLKWDRYIVRYSLRDQLAAVQTLREESDQLRAQVAGFVALVTRRLVSLRADAHALIQAGGWTGGGIALAAVGLVVLLIVSLRRWGIRSRLAARPGPASHLEAVRLYRQMLRLLDRHGLPKRPGTTPYEHALNVAGQWQEAGRIVYPVTELYCRVRFGQDLLTPDALKNAEELLSGLRAGPPEVALTGGRGETRIPPRVR